MKKNVIYFWLPKTAGTSIHDVLKQYSCPLLKERRRYKTFNNEGFVTFGHVSIAYLLDKNIVEQEYLDSAFKFCFVRNPWDRLVSLYYYLKYDKKMSFKSFCHLVQKAHKLQDSFSGKTLQRIYNTDAIYDFSQIGFSASNIARMGSLPLPML